MDLIDKDIVLLTELNYIKKNLEMFPLDISIKLLILENILKLSKLLRLIPKTTMKTDQEEV
jgi:hypothetical protein